MADTMTLEGSRDYLLAMHGGYECVSPEFSDTVYKRMADAIDAAIKQCEQDAKDAARYRWLAEVCGDADLFMETRNKSELDARIDAAMVKESGNG